MVWRRCTGSYLQRPQRAAASQLLYREDEERIAVADGGLPWSFDADANTLRLVSEARRIKLAYLFDPYLAVHTSQIEPLPHQISAVYEKMLPRMPLRYVLADDPGAGKTIMTGLLLKELIIRGDLKRCLIVTPGNLCEQWQDELYRKFHLHFEILTNDRLESAVSGNAFTEMNYCIARMDKLSRSEDVQAKLKASEWDLIVIDEAHKMSATVWGGEVKYTKRFQLGRLLSEITNHYLLLTATPHNGKDEDFQLFMSLIDADRFEGVSRSGHQAIEVSDVMRRLVKEELLKFDGRPLFPERLAYTVNYDLSPQEAQLYAVVTQYVQEEFNRADQLTNDRKNTVGFALTILQRRLASSPEAIYQSLRRRRERLENRLAEEKLGKRAAEYQSGINFDADFDDDDLTADELEETEENVSDQASAASTISELEAEIATLKRLEKLANEVRMSGLDRKWEELSSLLQDNAHMFDARGSREKLIVFTEHRDTLNYLTNKIRSLLGDEKAVVTIHGGMLRDERRKIEELFKQDKEVCVLVATDAAGEGINLQRAHLMINYDLPWNPNRLEQRFGRIHRIGQTEVCHLWNLVSKETREGQVFQRLFSKLEEERNALGGKVFDILGKLSFENKPLRELLIEAIRYGNQPDVRERMNQAVDNAMQREALELLLKEHALTEDSMDIHRVITIREEMDRIEAHKLQPHFIEAFFLEAFQKLGGSIRKREKGRYEILSVPYTIRNRDRIIGFGEPVLTRYERVCFDKEFAAGSGLTPATLICPGHPLLEATLDIICERYAAVLKQGAAFIDDSDPGSELRILYYIEDAIQDGQFLPNGARRVISRQVHFVEIQEDGTARNAGYAPYLDYRAASDEEQKLLPEILKNPFLRSTDIESRANAYAIEQIIPLHFSQVKKHKLKMIERTAKAVRERLTTEIQYWDYRAADLKEKEDAGKTNARLNSMMAARKADELSARLERRMAELEAEKQLAPLPPLITGGALVIPRGLLRQLNGEPAAEEAALAAARRAIELAAMNAVMNIERKLGFEPKDVSRLNCGYDVESTVVIPAGKTPENAERSLRFIEVKGSVKGSTMVTVSANEILTALNKPDEFILAVVEVDGESTHVIYLNKPFRDAPGWGVVSVNFDLSKLIKTAGMFCEGDSGEQFVETHNWTI